jgi:hypothetical protein
MNQTKKQIQSSINKIRYNISSGRGWDDQNTQYHLDKLGKSKEEVEAELRIEDLIDFTDPINESEDTEDQIVRLYKEIRERNVLINALLQDISETLKPSGVIPEVMYTPDPYKEQFEKMFEDLCKRYSLTDWDISFITLKDRQTHTLPNFVTKTLYVDHKLLNNMTYQQIYIICLRAVGDILAKKD